MHLFMEAGGGVGRYGGDSAVPRGSSPASGTLSQLYPREGLYNDPSEGPPGGGGNPGGGSGDSHPNPLPQIRVLAPSMNSSLKGTPPTIFDGNCKNTKQFMQEFTLYHIINQDTSTIRNAYTCAALALSFMCGPAINN